MRVIIAGSRWPYNLDELYRELGRQHIRFALRDSGFIITELISGAAEGIDTLAARMALEDGIPVRQFPAQWRVNGQIDRLAGFKRNELMARNADALIAIWANGSSGTKDMIDRARRHALAVYVSTPFFGNQMKLF